MRKRIEDGTIEEWNRIFPVAYGAVRLDASNLRYGGKDRYSLADRTPTSPIPEPPFHGPAAANPEKRIPFKKSHF